VLALNVLVLVLVHIPSVQAFLARQAAEALSSKIGTEVSVGRIDLGFFNRLIIDQVNIKDQQHADLFTADRMTARLQLLPLLEGRVSISSAQLFGLHAHLYQQDSCSAPNYQFLLDAFSSSEDTTRQSSFDVNLNSLIIRRSSAASSTPPSSPTAS